MPCRGPSCFWRRRWRWPGSANWQTPAADGNPPRDLEDSVMTHCKRGRPKRRPIASVAGTSSTVQEVAVDHRFDLGWRSQGGSSTPMRVALQHPALRTVTGAGHLRRWGSPSDLQVSPTDQSGCWSTFRRGVKGLGPYDGAVGASRGKNMARALRSTVRICSGGISALGSSGSPSSLMLFCSAYPRSPSSRVLPSRGHNLSEGQGILV